MVKILFLVQLPPPVHGVSIMNENLLKNRSLKEKYKIDILPLHFGQTIDDIGKVTFKKLYYLFSFSFSLLYKLIKFNPSIVYFTIMPTGFIFYRDAFFIRLIKLFNKKIIIHLHGKGIADSIKSKSFRRSLYRTTFKNTYVICLSESLKQDIKEVYDSEPFVVPNGIEILEPNINEVVNQPPVILYLSNLVKNKGIEVFMESLLRLHKQNIPFVANVVGDSVDYTIDDAKEFCIKHGLENKVKIRGPKYGQDKLEELENADIFVLPSFNECFPLTILEAMRSATPVIASDVGGIADMITDNEEGLVIKPNDANDLVNKLKLLLNDAAIRSQMGRKGRLKFTKEYTLDAFHQNMSAIFEIVVKDK